MRLAGNSPTAGQHDITSTITLDAAASGALVSLSFLLLLLSRRGVNDHDGRG